MKASEFSRTRKNVILVGGFLEMFLFSGVIFGWADLTYALKADGVFGSFCNQTGNHRCPEQDNLFDLAFTVAVSFKGGSAILVALLLDHWGLRFSRNMSNLLIAVGGFFVGYTKVNNYLLFPGLLLICLGGSQVRINNFLVANLFPVHKSTIISLYNGAFSASGAVFLSFKYGHNSGFRMKTLCSLWSGVSGLMLLSTMFLLPEDTIEPDEDSDHYIQGTDVCYKCHQHFESEGLEDRLAKLFISTREKNVDSESVLQQSSTSPRSVSTTYLKRQSEFCQSLLSAAFFLHVIWSSICFLGIMLFAGSFLTLVEIVVGEQTQSNVYASGNMKVMRMAELYGLSQLPMIFIAPLGGAVMDYHLYRARRAPDLGTRHVRERRGGFVCLIFTTLLIICLYVCIIFRQIWTLQLSLVFFILSKPMLNAVSVAYLRVRFPAKYFNRLFGTLVTVTSIIGFLQFPFFVWSGYNHVAAYCTVIGLCLVGLANPVHLMLSPKKKCRRNTCLNLVSSTSI